MNIFTRLCKKLVGVEPVEEYRFHPSRRWRFDFAFQENKVAVEIDGGVWINGRHNRPTGFLKDIEKFNEAAVLGWRVLRFTPSEINKEDTYCIIKKALEYGD